MIFKSIDYLKNGNQLQKEAHKVLTENEVMDKLANFQPLLVGTIPIDIAIKNSDLDIVCSFEEKEVFKKEILKHFNDYPRFSIVEKTFQDEPTVIVRFELEDFPVEIFAQNKPSNQQMAYQHMLIEYKVLIDKEEEFRKEIIRLKESGIKTEPAFAQLLNLKGDSYQALLDYGKQQKII
ncbi:DUF4269 domain-containing protein [Marivirga salinae]|uniref:DUF4269 domain-containing protein n=1 Tax=Marivirga salinarum TaxID=3059078 RepID=A0AA49GD14_9BACT|nr:DUF4269 domain-containing protein [Marivirga sp. BDSF4-3]WKK77338.2 DUF4269 domain-containing protein [Marivirga sp. BDSF4-3]